MTYSVDLEKPRILVLQPPPVVSIGDGQPLITPVGSRITELTGTKLTLTCPTEGLPRPKITWKKNGVILSGRYVIDKTGSLTIQIAEVNDTGQFTCSAQNVVGVDAVSSLIDILGKYFCCNITKGLIRSKYRAYFWMEYWLHILHGMWYKEGKETGEHGRAKPNSLGAGRQAK